MPKDWEPLRDEIRKLYLAEEKPLDEVMRLVKGKHGFIASERSYRTQLKKWRFTKYSTEAFPKPKTRARPSNRPRQRHAAALLNPRGFNGFQGEVSLSENFPAATALNSGRSDLYFATPQLSSLPFPASQFDGFGEGTQEGSLFHAGQNAQNDQGRTQLHQAILDDDLDRVRLLLHAGAAVDTRHHVGNTTLHSGVNAGNLHIVKLILQFGADVNSKNNLGQAPLHLALSHPHLIEMLIEQGADASVQDDNGDTPLHFASSAHIFSTIDTLLKLGADPNKENHNKATPFLNLLKRRSCEHGALNSIHVFLKAGGSVNQVLPDGRTPFEIFLSRAGNRGHALWKYSSLENSILRCFLDKGASVTTPMPSGDSLVSEYIRTYENGTRFGGRRSYLHSADTTLGEDLFKLITPDEVKQDGNSILLALVSHTWRATGDVGNFIATLLQRGANPNHQDHLGKSASLLLLQRQQHKPPAIEGILTALLEHGADPWQRDHTGKCALFVAAEMSPAHKGARMMLEADLRERETAGSPEPGDDGVAKSESWDGWRQAAQAVNWSESKELIILRGYKFPSDRIGNVIRECAFGVLAEKHVRLARDKFQGDAAEKELRRQYVAGIIRDCRHRGVFLDTSCMDYLVDLCL